MEETQITEWVERFLEATREGFYLVDVNWNKKTHKLEVFIDSDGGVTLRDCQQLSRELEKEFDENQMLGENYILDVSSPGIDRPLKLKRQYVQNIGRIVRVELQDGGEIIGRLEKVEEDQIGVRPEITGVKGRKTTFGEEKLILWKNIKQTIVQIRF
jgi:ribosome maturation factor RimP